MHPIIVGGSGTSGSTNTMAFSYDGVKFEGLGKTVFSTSCNCVEWNGQLWVAGGQGTTNTLAYSYDGRIWTGLGTAVFSTSVSKVVWNGTIWLAMGSGVDNSLATSVDGITWVGLGLTTFPAGAKSADWNGTAWVAVGGNVTTTRVAYSSDANAANWTAVSTNVFATTQGIDVRWVKNRWIAVGEGGNTLAYTTTLNGSTGWTGVTSGLGIGKAIKWNGRVAVAVGSGPNTIATSTDLTTWTGRGVSTFSSTCNDIIYYNDRWIAVGQGGNTMAYSFDPTSTWYTMPNDTNIFSTSGIGLNSCRSIGLNLPASSLYLRKGDKFMVASPDAYDAAITSDTTITFSLSQSL